MSLRDPFLVPQDAELGLFLGMDVTAPLMAMRPGTFREAYNCRPGLFGGVDKRGGCVPQLTTAWGSLSITGGVEFRVDTLRRLVLFGTDGAIGKLGFVDGGAVTEILDTLDGAARPTFAQGGGRLFFFNGSDAPRVYDGLAVRPLGIAAPSAAPTAPAQTSGGSPGLTPLASYQWCYTYYNSATGAESSPSLPLAVALTGSNNKVTFTVVPGDVSTADTIRIYRTGADGLEFWLEQELPILATAVTSEAGDNELTDPLELDNSRLADFGAVGNYPVVAQNRLFVITGPNEGRFSKIGLRGPMPESFQARAFYTTVGTFGDTDAVVGQAKAGDVVIVLKERSVGALVRQGLPDFDSAADPVQYEYVEISGEHGAVSHFAATEVLGHCLFLGYDNIYLTRGQGPGDIQPIATELSALIRSLGLSASQRRRVSCINNSRHKYVIFSVFRDSNSPVPDWQLVGSYQTFPEFRWTVYRSGPDPETHPGWPVGSFFKVKALDGSEDVYFGNFGGDGQYYRTEAGDSDDGAGIYFRLVTRPYAGPLSAVASLWKRVVTYVQGDGTAYGIHLRAIFGLSGIEERAVEFSLDPGGARWDEVIWDEFVWPTNLVPPRRHDLHRKATHVQLVFEQTEANAPVMLSQWQISGSSFGLF